MECFHDTDSYSSGCLEQYLDQFQSPETWLITMELDMTQTAGGILKFVIHNEPNKKVNQIRTDGAYTNIAFDDIDITKQYRFSFCFGRSGCDKWIELVSPNT